MLPYLLAGKARVERWHLHDAAAELRTPLWPAVLDSDEPALRMTGVIMVSRDIDAVFEVDWS